MSTPTNGKAPARTRALEIKLKTTDPSILNKNVPNGKTPAVGPVGSVEALLSATSPTLHQVASATGPSVSRLAEIEAPEFEKQFQDCILTMARTAGGSLSLGEEALYMMTRLLNASAGAVIIAFCDLCGAGGITPRGALNPDCTVFRAFPARPSQRTQVDRRR